MWPVISGESLAASRWSRQAHSGGQSPRDVLCETGMETACGMLEETTGISSCFLYYDIFLSKPTSYSEFILHECCHIQADFEVYLKWWAWLCWKASRPKPSSPSPLPPCTTAWKSVNRPPKMVTPSISQLLSPQPWCLLSPSPQSSSAWFQHRSNICHVNPGTAGCLAMQKRWNGMGWKVRYPGSKGLLILDRRILIYTIRDKSIINPVLNNCSGYGKELSVQQPGELKTRYNLQKWKRRWALENIFLEWNRNLGKVLLSSPHSPSLCSEMGVPAFPLR